MLLPVGVACSRRGHATGTRAAGVGGRLLQGACLRCHSTAPLCAAPTQGGWPPSWRVKSSVSALSWVVELGCGNLPSRNCSEFPGRFPGGGRPAVLDLPAGGIARPGPTQGLRELCGAVSWLLEQRGRLRAHTRVSDQPQCEGAVLWFKTLCSHKMSSFK